MQPDPKEHLLTAGSSMLASGVARVFAMRVVDRIVGVYYGFLHHGRAFYYLCGFDPTFRQYGIGNQLIAHGLALAGREGASCLDFLRGQEPYKYRWGARDRPTFCRRLYRDRVLKHGAPELFQPRVDSDAAMRSVA